MSENDHKPPSRYAESRLQAIVDSFNTPREEREHVYMPVALAHVFFPRRDEKLGPAESWKHTSGNFSLRIKQISVEDPRTGEDKFLGVPFGAQSRLLLGLINKLALKQGSNKIDIEADTLAEFMRTAGFSAGGNQLKQARNQIARLSSSIISVSYRETDGSSLQSNMPIVKGFDLFPRSQADQQLLWKRHINLSLDYWEELQKHPLPLALEHMLILKGNVRAIDFYTFLAYRLHSLRQPLFLSWAIMKDIFGKEIVRMDHFKEKMREVAKLMKVTYKEAKFSYDGQGWTFQNSPAPIQSRRVIP